MNHFSLHRIVKPSFIFAILVLGSIAACGPGSSEEVTATPISLLDPLWSDFASEHPDNRYLPFAAIQSSDGIVTREHVAAFQAYREARAALRSGELTSSQLNTYLLAKSDDLEQREIVLNFVTSLGADLFASHQIIGDEAAYLQRKIEEMQMPTFESTLRIIEDDQAVDSADQEIVCIERFGLVICVPVVYLTDAYLGGIWDAQGKWQMIEQHEARAYDILHMLDRIDDLFDLDPEKNTRLRCGNGMVFDFDLSRSPGSAISPAEMSVMANLCKQTDPFTSSSGEGSVPGSGGGLGKDSDFVNDTVARIDAEMESCVDRADTGLEAGSSDPVNRKALEETMRELTKPNWQKFLEAWAAAEEHDRLRREREAAEAQADLDSMLADIEQAEQAAQLAEYEAAELQAAADAEEDEAEKARKQKEADEAKKKAEQARKEAECRRKSGMSCADWEKAKEEKAKSEEQPNRSEDFYDDMSYCEAKRATWEWFKSRCEGRWDQPGSECNEFLRRVNGCVSTSVILPHPDGDNTCVREEIEETELLEMGCEERKKVQSIAVGFLDPSCDLPQQMPPKFPIVDTCTDPATEPLPDQDCDDAVVVEGNDGSGSGGITPILVGDAIQLDAVQILDTLGAFVLVPELGEQPWR